MPTKRLACLLTCLLLGLTLPPRGGAGAGRAPPGPHRPAGWGRGAGVLLAFFF